ncbi:deoxyribose-phosphate aldolase [Dermacoccus nishinomiyaensis]|uniref:Deoxyribose-phosphate aldolase n=1 Tax=Dermacoccus nishinomiyaensis TaxID=1274 RepID=A0A075JMB7_9MICO|nr:MULTISPECIES: deoxyribose-phosphate aldolase [Dermacoccus]HCQ18006.1 deoxyribose-phosphate aldolase [Dermacoccus sp.]AIF41258.1 deoxyribose-phosphate aldolase [Dermacoccus nishinomiyaensis]EFP58695.1 deoxyribose-phosphate aldolase [Dermacoccus sp. Ellin185]MBO1758449.1 deoxyribose-phosphate aldolase [Dermacoccus sp. NHGro5]MCG7429491.1 deoxyribose-phosphate aldolase [Dermacoccus nishinomiyaensis]
MNTAASSSSGSPFDRAHVASIVDHTLLKPEATRADVDALAREAEALGAYSICVSPSMLPVETSVKVATVCGFPSGKHTSAVKAAEAAESVARGADEVDMVIDVGAAKDGRFDDVEADVRAVREATEGRVLKVIIESAALSDDEIVAVCRAAVAAGADFVKTSTGFHPAGGASEHAVRLMRQTVGPDIGVKASGGIRDAAAAHAMIAAGASRLGLSGTRVVLDGLDGDATGADAPQAAAGY